MAEDSERIGGINVGIGGSDDALEAALNAAESKIKAWVQRVSADARISVSGPTTGTGGGGGSGVSLDTRALEAKLDQLIGALGRAGGVGGAARQARAEAEQVTINGVRVGRLSQLGDSLQKAIGPVDVDADVEQATSKVSELRIESEKPIEINFDTSAIAELAAELKTLRETAAAPLSIQAAPAATGGAGRVRRAHQAPVPDEEEIDPYQIAMQRNVGVERLPRDAEVEANRREFATRQKMFVSEVSAAGRREAEDASRKASVSEQQLLDALFPNPASETQSAAEQYMERQDIRYRTPAEIGALRRQQAEIAARRQQQPRRQSSGPPPPVENLPFEGFPDDGGFRGRGRGGGRYARTEADVEERERQRIAAQEAQRVAAGRTARTQASSLGGFALGGGRGLIEAQAALAAANEKVAISERRLRDPEVLRSRVAVRQATEELTVAQNEQADALKRVQSFSGFAAGARSLLAVTAAGAAFGIGLQAIGVAFQAAERAASPYFDAFTGYAQKTVDYTAALSDQVRAQQGQAQNVTALRLAQAGFAQTTAASIQPVIAQRAQIEAGNKALQEQIDTFRVAEAIRKQSATAGLGTTTGGILGTPLFGIPSTGEQTGNFLQGLRDQLTQTQGFQAPPSLMNPTSLLPGLFGPRTLGGGGNTEGIDQATTALQRGVDFVNEQLKKGAVEGQQPVRFVTTQNKALVEETAQAFDNLSPEMAQAIRELGLTADAISGLGDGSIAMATRVEAATRALEDLNRAGLLTGSQEQLAAQRIAQQNAANSIEALRSQQQYELPAFFAQLVRQQQVQVGIQLPAQAALANLANPPTPVGTGIAPANAKEQARINDTLVETQRLQDTLNAYYEKGKQVLQDTYRPAIVQTFGTAAGQVFDNLIGQITSVGSEIAGIQTRISNEQAAYTTAQYNYQLFIARRTLSDIAGLTGKNFGEGKSYLGVLEGQNLALSRQGQLLQFALSQRQINLQRAIAGFVVPGLTPAEQNARVEEARIEASFAQRQLDIQKQMFRNQVKIVDISNLRQGADLVKQIRLLEQGRQVTIDTAAAQQKLERLNKVQQALVAEAGTYISAVDAQIAKASADMAAQEQALGKALNRIEMQAVGVAYRVGRALFVGMTGGFLGGGGGGGGGGAGGSGPSGNKLQASGGIWTASTPNSVTFGEAGTETVAVLRNPRTGPMAVGAGGDGGDSIVNFYGDITVRTEADIAEIARRVTAAQGRMATLKGLRTPN